MLPAAHRLTDASSFRRALRRGRRASSRTVVVSVLLPEHRPDHEPSSTPPADAPVRLGLVVSKAVGIAVVRTRVKRRLRHLVAARLAQLPPGANLVVRALPPAGAASSAELGRDLDRCVVRCLEPRSTRQEVSA